MALLVAPDPCIYAGERQVPHAGQPQTDVTFTSQYLLHEACARPQ